MELTEKHVELLFFIKDERTEKGTCSFSAAATRFGDKMVMEMMTDYSLITYDGKKPLGLKWSDIAEEVFSIDEKMKSWYAPAGMKRGAMESMGFTIRSISPQCDPRLQDIEDIPDTTLSSEDIPTEDQLGAISIGQGVKLSSNGQFFWVTIVNIKEMLKDSGIIAYFGKVIDDSMQKHDIKKDEVLEFCGAHICDII